MKERTKTNKIVFEKRATLVGNHNGSLCMETVTGAATALTNVCLDKDNKAEASLCHVYRQVLSSPDCISCLACNTKIRLVAC